MIVADDEVTNRMVAAMNLGMSGFDEERITNARTPRKPLTYEKSP
jgi:hypothetical protein